MKKAVYNRFPPESQTVVKVQKLRTVYMYNCLFPRTLYFAQVDAFAKNASLFRGMYMEKVVFPIAGQKAKIGICAVQQPPEQAAIYAGGKDGNLKLPA